MKETRVDLTSRDTEAFARLVREHQKAVFSIAYAKLGNAHDAEDIKQEVFVEAWRNLQKLAAHERVQAWLFTVTVNRCKDYLRKKFRREKREVVYMESSPQELKDIQNDPEVYEKVLKAVSDLPEKIRMVIMLKHLAQMSYDEISKMTGLSKTTIDGRLRMGKKKMRQRLLELETK
jgi:RNA polymerase sigma-70 factor (ECF subfamily)